MPAYKNKNRLCHASPFELRNKFEFYELEIIGHKHLDSIANSLVVAFLSIYVLRRDMSFAFTKVH